MKKLILSLTALLVLAGCKDASADISFNETLFSVEGTVIKQKDLYEVMKQYDAGVMASAVIIDTAKEELVKDVELTDDMKEKAKEEVSFIKDLLGDGYLEAIQEIGFETEEDYLEEMIYPNLLHTELIKDEVLEDIETLNEEYAPRLVRILELKKDAADAALQEIKDGKEFDEVAEKNALIESAFNGDKQVHLLKTTQLPEIVSEFLKTNSATLSDVLTTDEMETSFIVQIIDVDASRFEEEALEAYLSVEAIVNKYDAALYRKNNFKVYDRDIYDSIFELNPAYFEENTGE